MVSDVFQHRKGEMKMNKELLKKGLLTGITVAKKCCKIIIPIIALGVLGRVEKPVSNNITYYNSEANYGNAVKAVMNSDMFPSHKNDTVSILPMNQTSSFYIGVIETVNSDMFSSNKVSCVKSMVANVSK